MFLKGKRAVVGEQSLWLTVLRSVTSVICPRGMEELLFSSQGFKRGSSEGEEKEMIF